MNDRGIFDLLFVHPTSDEYIKFKDDLKIPNKLNKITEFEFFGKESLSKSVRRIQNLPLVNDIFDKIFPTLSLNLKILVIDSFKQLINNSPYNGKILATDKSINFQSKIIEYLKAENDDENLICQFILLTHYVRSFNCDVNQFKLYYSYLLEEGIKSKNYLDLQKKYCPMLDKIFAIECTLLFFQFLFFQFYSFLIA